MKIWPLWLWEDVRVHGQPVDVAILADGEGHAYVAVRIRYLARLDVDLARRALELADRSIFHLSLSLERQEPKALVNKPLEDPPEDMTSEWTKPLTVDHLEAIGKVRRALEAGCRTIDEIVDYTGLWHIDVYCALRYLLGDVQLEKFRARRKR